MIVLSGADLVLPDRMLTPGTLVMEGDRIVEVRASLAPGSAAHGAPLFALHGHYIVPGFVDVHVHGVDGFDAFDILNAVDIASIVYGGNPVSAMAARMPRFGVTAFCPTTTACAPDDLRRVLRQVRLARETPAPRAARVLPAHLESNFITPEDPGAQPLACLRSPRAALAGPGTVPHPVHDDDQFTATDILKEIERSADDVGIVTLAPELDGGLELIRWLTARGRLASLGHSGATYEQGLDAVAAGARQATHLFNRMPPVTHRAPGLAGAMLQSEAITAELICDGEHVHPAMLAIAVAAKQPSRVMAVTDGTAVAGLARGAWASLGGQAITAGRSTALLRDGTAAGSLITMDSAFRTLVERAGLSLVAAATMCAATPARELGLAGHGVLAPGAVADLVVLDSKLEVVQTYIGGQLVYARTA